MEKKNFTNFLRQKTIAGMTKKDMVFARHATEGLSTKTMLFQDGQSESTLYVGLNKDDTTYLSVSDDLFDLVDTKTVTVRDNFNAKNTMFNMLVVLNSWIESTGVSKEYLMQLDSDALLLLVHMHEPSLDFASIINFLDEGNPIHNYIITRKSSLESDNMLKKISDGTYDKATRSVSGYTPNTTGLLNLIVYKSKEKPKSKSGKEAPSGKEGSGLDESIKKTFEESAEESKDSTATELEKLDGSIIDGTDGECDDDYFFYEESKLSKKNIEDIDKYARQIASKLRGKNGKITTISPSKKVNIKNFVKKIPNFYNRKSDLAKGKKISLNVIIDCSGSMSGTPMNNASSVAMIFEIIACQEKTVTGHVILTSREGSKALPFGLGSKDLLSKISAFSGSEGIEKAITQNMELLQKADYNICISDAQITDEPINRKKYEARNVFIDGLYIKKTKNKKSHIEHMEKYFSRAKMFDDLEASVEYISNVVIQK